MQDSQRIEVVSELTDWQIARLLMSMLWVRYDLGGISCRRSLRSFLLEIILSNMEKPGCDFDLDILEAEATNRKSMGAPEQLVLDLGITGLPGHIFVCFIFREINKCYQKCYQKGYEGGEERKIIRILFSLLRVEEHLRQFDDRGITYSPSELITQGDNVTRSMMDIDISMISGLYY